MWERPEPLESSVRLFLVFLLISSILVLIAVDCSICSIGLLIVVIIIIVGLFASIGIYSVSLCLSIGIRAART